MKKIIILSLALILALAVVGVGYAGWFATLVVNGTVNTGSLDASIVEMGGYDTEPTEKNVSGITCEVIDGVLIVTVTNAYPSITYTNEFVVTNTGTIPLHIYDVILGSVPADVDITVEVDGMSGGYVQLHTGESASGRVTVHLQQTAAENDTICFSATIECCNWNEIP